MKRIGSLLVVFLVLLLFLSATSCGREKEELSTVNENNSAEIDFGDTSEIHLGAGTKLEVPADFPKHILPIMEGAQFQHIVKNDYNGSIAITYHIAARMEQVVTFYKGATNEASHMQEFSMEETYMLMGMKGGYSLAITIAGTPDYTFVYLSATQQ